ncbi:hypothetical protein BDV96DRAFT_399706 [Lophiotrema nucula]|uniref:SET domain-containing protein n=1 Tax=Lophiotrema nucula TaxID=690887 RepID=A0A6A5ZG33_9PLEO|nr:hypothetical protein BDV96DRAFT_399706 [Lophiotrema nucula]
MSITPPASIRSSASPRPSTPLEAPLPSHIPLARCANLVIIPNTPKGRGVFTSAFISKGSVIDVCPVLLLGLEENVKHIGHTSLYHYTYNWPTIGENGNKKVAQAVVFGLGSMFNHSTQNQNVGWERDTERGIITYKALRNIEDGEELCE